jgi:type IV pilus assembly protein PilY1
MPATFHLRPILMASLLGAVPPLVLAAPLPLSKAPPSANSSEPAPNVVLSIDDSGSMMESLDPSNPSLGRKDELLKQSLAVTFGNGSPNSGIIPDGRIRLAWHAMHNNGNAPGADSLTPGAINSMRPFSGAHRTRFNQFVQSINAGGGTPALAMMQRVFEYGRAPAGLHSPWADNPGAPQNPPAKPYMECRRMYHILLTDGGWNSQSASERVSQGDSKPRTLGDGTTLYSPMSNQSHVFRDAFGDTNPSSASTLADFAFHKWATDLQDGTGGTANMANLVRPLIRKSGSETFATPACTAAGNCIATQQFWNPRNDPANWQHIVQHTIGFGMGTVNWTFRRSPAGNTQLYYTNQTLYNASSGSPKSMASAADIAQRTTPLDWENNNPSKNTFGGDLSRLIQGELTWPNVKPEQSSFDSEVSHTRPIELWHAAINGRGRFYPVTTPNGLTAAFTDILNQVIKDTSVPLVSIATNSSTLRQGMVAYIGGYSSAQGTGSLSARPINAATGDVLSTENWNAATLLDALTPAQISSRVVLTFSGSQGIAFRNLAALPAAAQQALNRDEAGNVDGRAQARINYIRGDNSQSQEQGGPFRSRSSRLGAIVNSSVLYVGAPAGAVGASGYAGFANSSASRAPMLYGGASDGMLHGFSAASGAERLAYVPQGIAQGRLRDLTDTDYELQYLVDGSPFSGDAYLGVSEGWRTMLVGTSGNGGKGYFILDVSNPDGFSDSAANAIVHTDTTASTDRDIGHIGSAPALDDSNSQSRQIVKLNNGRWAVVLGNGANSTNEAPVLLLQYLDGDRLLRKISPCPQPIQSIGCSFKGSNGLSTPALVDLNGDGVMDLAYAGDMQGHVWKFDLRGSTESSWSVSFSGQPLFVARRGGVAQPITAAPFTAAHPAGGLMVVVGTGQNLTNADQTSTAIQSLYGLWDISTYGSNPIGSPVNTVGDPNLSNLVQQIYNPTPFVDSGSKYFVSSNAPAGSNNGSNDRGWYMDWPLSGQRVVANMRSFAGRKFMVESMIPAANSNTGEETCSPAAQAGRRFLSVLNLVNGGTPATPTFMLTGSYAGTTNATMVEMAAGESALFRTPTMVKLVNSDCPSGKVCAAKTLNPGQTLGARTNWRHILQ